MPAGLWSRWRRITDGGILHSVDADADGGAVYPYYPPREAYIAVADLACELWFRETRDRVRPALVGIADDPGLVAEFLTAGMHTATTYRLLVASGTPDDFGGGLTAYAAGGRGVLLSETDRAFLTNHRLLISRGFRQKVLDAFRPASFDLAWAFDVIMRGSPQIRAETLLTVTSYVAHLLQGVYFAQDAWRSDGLDASDELLAFHRTRYAFRVAERCAEEILRAAPGTGPRNDFVRKAQRSLTRAGLLIAERPEVWSGEREELLRDVALPFMASSGLIADGEARIYSGKADIGFRDGGIGEDHFHRGVVEFNRWNGTSSFAEAWRQLTLEHATGHETYLAAVVLLRENRSREVTDALHDYVIDQGVVEAAPRYKGGGTLAGVDGLVSVRGSDPVPFGVFVYELYYVNPRRNPTDV